MLCKSCGMLNNKKNKQTKNSSRTASTSYNVNAQLLLADILKAGGWSNARTFAEHYNKPFSGKLGQTLLTHFDSAGQAQAN